MVTNGGRSSWWGSYQTYCEWVRCDKAQVIQIHRKHALTGTKFVIHLQAVDTVDIRAELHTR